eukprot:170002_1
MQDVVLLMWCAIAFNNVVIPLILALELIIYLMQYCPSIQLHLTAMDRIQVNIQDRTRRNKYKFTQTHITNFTHSGHDLLHFVVRASTSFTLSFISRVHP